LPNRKNISRYQDGCETRGFSKGRRSPKGLAKPSDDRAGGSAARSPCRGPSRGCQSYANRLSAAGPQGSDDAAGAPHSSGEVRGAISQAQVRWRTFGPDGAPIRHFRDTFRDRRCFRDPQLAFQEAVALQALGEWRAACACAQRQSLPSHRLAAGRLISSLVVSSLVVSSRRPAWVGAANQDQQRAAVRTALIFVQVLSPSAASCDDRGILERAQRRSLQSVDRHMRDVVGSRNRNIGLRLARSKALESFLALVGKLMPADGQISAASCAARAGRSCSPTHSIRA